MGELRWRQDGFQVPGTVETFHLCASRGRKTREEDPIQGESTMDCHYSFHLLGLLSDSSVWNHVIRLSRSLLLASRNYGIRYWTNCHFWSNHATFGWCKDLGSWRYS